jgi:hypothetical protein
LGRYSAAVAAIRSNSFSGDGIAELGEEVMFKVGAFLTETVFCDSGRDQSDHRYQEKEHGIGAHRC